MHKPPPNIRLVRDYSGPVLETTRLHFNTEVTYTTIKANINNFQTKYSGTSWRESWNSKRMSSLTRFVSAALLSAVDCSVGRRGFIAGSKLHSRGWGVGAGGGGAGFGGRVGGQRTSIVRVGGSAVFADVRTVHGRLSLNHVHVTIIYWHKAAFLLNSPIWGRSEWKCQAQTQINTFFRGVQKQTPEGGGSTACI